MITPPFRVQSGYLKTPLPFALSSPTPRARKPCRASVTALETTSFPPLCALCVLCGEFSSLSKDAALHAPNIPRLQRLHRFDHYRRRVFDTQIARIEHEVIQLRIVGIVDVEVPLVVVGAGLVAGDDSPLGLVSLPDGPRPSPSRPCPPVCHGADTQRGRLVLQDDRAAPSPRSRRSPSPRGR